MVVNDRYVPLIKYGEIFFPVHEHHLRIIFLIKLIAIGELRLQNKMLNEGLHPKNDRGLVVGNDLTPPPGLNWWATLAFDNDETIVLPCLKKARDELKKLMSEH